jgi:sugar phosphate isomerase/epimerase
LTKYTELKHQLGVTTAAGLETLMRFGLNTEVPMSDDIEHAGYLSDILVSAHAPATIGEQRLNIAATDADFRKTSIAVITDYIETARQYPLVKQINMHFAPKRWHDATQPVGQIGEYELLIEGVREVGAFCEKHDIELVLENNNSYWSPDIKDTPFDQVNWSERNEYFGMAPEDWQQVAVDVDRHNVGLCLDSSHVVTYAHRFPEGQREERVLAFLSRPELIRHVHWNDNYLYDNRGRNDSHAALNHGSLPTEMHRRIKYLDAKLLMEHFHGADVLEEELAFIDGL